MWSKEQWSRIMIFLQKIICSQMAGMLQTSEPRTLDNLMTSDLARTVLAIVAPTSGSSLQTLLLNVRQTGFVEAMAAIKHRIALMALTRWEQSKIAQLTSSAGGSLNLSDATKSVKAQLSANDITPEKNARTQSKFWTQMLKSGHRWLEMSRMLGEAVVFLPPEALATAE